MERGIEKYSTEKKATFHRNFQYFNLEVDIEICMEKQVMQHWSKEEIVDDFSFYEISCDSKLFIPINDCNG